MKRVICSLLFLSVTAALFSQGLGNLSSGSGPKLGLKKAGLRAGLVIPSTKYDPGFGLGAEVDLGNLTGILGLGIDFDYWHASEENSDKTITGYSCLGVGLNALIRPQLDTKVGIVFGGGIGLNHYKRDYPENWSNTDETETNPFEPRVFIGAEYPYSPKIDFIAKFKATFSNVSSYGIYLGAQFSLLSE
jgi:hypothetical protein